MTGLWQRVFLPFCKFSSLLPLLIAALLLVAGGGQGGASAAAPPAAPTPPAPWRRLTPPRAHLVADLLVADGSLPAAAAAAGTAPAQQAVVAWFQQMQKETRLGPDPAAFQRLLAREKALLRGDVAVAEASLPTPPVAILAVVVEFAGADAITRPYPHPVTAACTPTPFTFAPLTLGQDPPPGPRDNFTFYKPGITLADYESVIFGVGADAPGYGLVRPDLGGIDLRGYTLNNYLLEMSRGRYQVGGGILPTILQLPHAHEYYGYAAYTQGADGRCRAQPDTDANFLPFLQDVAAAIRLAHGNGMDWARFDADGDHIIDLAFIIHAGQGWQDGGNPDRLSRSSATFSAAGLPRPQIGGHATPDDPSDDYFLDPFALLPEQVDLGALHTEFAHHIGLPDLYALDGDTSNGFWGALAAGVWGGPLGGARPVGHTLWQDWLLGWRQPLVIAYDDPQADYLLGRARHTPAGLGDGLIIRLPPQELAVENRAGAGGGLWAGSGNDLDHRLWRSFDLRGAGSTILFSFDAAWEIEAGWDYGFIELSSDAGRTWQVLRDLDGILTGSNPHGRNLGWGITGSGNARLRFALSAYRNQTVHLRLRYITDDSTAYAGWWVDNLSLDDEFGNLYSNELEFDLSDWQNEGWQRVPLVEYTDHYYLVEWRDDNGFDRSLDDPYQLVFSDPPARETKVNRLPATTPGLLISYRNLGEPFDYELSSTLDAPPSYGPKYGLLAVEAHYDPLYFDTVSPNYQGAWVGVPISGRVASGDALFSHTPTLPWTARLGFDWDTYRWSSVPLETKTWPSRAGRPAFHDALGYTPGFFYPGAGSLIYLRDWDASAVIPARGEYSTPITWPDGEPYTDLYGVEVAPGRRLGSGHPGDAAAHYGLHIAVMAQSEEQAVVRVWQAFHELSGAAAASAPAAATGDVVTFQFAARNVGAAAHYLGFVSLPAGTVYVPGSVSGEFFPVGVSPQQAVAAWQQGDLQALAAAEVTGFVFLGQLNAGAEMGGGFSVQVQPHPGQRALTAELIFYLADGKPLRSYAHTLPLRNTPPQITLGAAGPWQEGDLFTAAGQFSDPDPDTWRATVDFGDGDGPQALALNPDKTFALAHRYVRDGIYTLTVRIDDGQDQAEATLAVNVTNAPPVIMGLPAALALTEGEELQVTGWVEDAGADVWTATVDFGEGAGPQPLTIAADQRFLLRHRYADAGQFMVNMTVTDGDAGDSAGFPVTVHNDPPRVHLDADATLIAGEVYRAAGLFSDAGADVWTATVDFGDGGGPQPLNLNPDKTFTLEHRYDRGGRYTVTVRVEDDDGDSGQAAAAVTVEVVATLPLLADTWVATAAAAENYNNQPGLIVRNSGQDNALLLFDRSLLPAGAEVLEATLVLHLYLESGAWGKQLIVLNTQAFDPAAVTFASAPIAFNPGEPVPVPPALGDLAIAVREQIAAWDAKGPDPERGYLAIAMSGPNGRVAIASLESWPPDQSPTLRVRFIPR